MRSSEVQNRCVVHTANHVCASEWKRGERWDGLPSALTVACAGGEEAADGAEDDAEEGV